MANSISVPVFEATNRLPALLAEVAKGTEVVITNRGVPLARLVPANAEAERWERGRRAGEVMNGLLMAQRRKRLRAEERDAIIGFRRTFRWRWTMPRRRRPGRLRPCWRIATG